MTLQFDHQTLKVLRSLEVSLLSQRSEILWCVGSNPMQTGKTFQILMRKHQRIMILVKVSPGKLFKCLEEWITNDFKI